MTRQRAERGIDRGRDLNRDLAWFAGGSAPTRLTQHVPLLGEFGGANSLAGDRVVEDLPGCALGRDGGQQARNPISSVSFWDEFGDARSPCRRRFVGQLMTDTW